MQLLMKHIDQLPPEISQELAHMEMEHEVAEMYESADEAQPCGYDHRHGEFCYCGDLRYLQ